MKSIPVYQLQNKTETGLLLKVFRPDDKLRDNVAKAEAHRDDHYLFFVLIRGSGTVTVDWQDIVMTAGQLYYILPSQIHYRIKPERAEGWYLAVDPSLIPPEFREVFENPVNVQVPRDLAAYELRQYTNLLNLLQEEYAIRQGDKYHLSILYGLVQSFVAMAASSYDIPHSAEDKPLRAAELARQFKSLLSQHSHTIKSPSAYASMLHVTLGHLNETIKRVTGSTVSYWIQQELFSEAKRLLYHSDEDIKQIAYQLGYADYSYFSRLFRKLSGMSPLKFRLSSRK